MSEQLDEEEKILREFAPRQTVLRLLRQNEGATIHTYKTPTGRECYRMLTAVDAQTPRDPLLNIAKHSVTKMLESGRLVNKGSYIILNPSFKPKKRADKSIGKAVYVPSCLEKLKKPMVNGDLFST